MNKGIILSLAGGFILGKAGDVVFGSKKAKEVYTVLTAGAFIAKDAVMEYVEEIGDDLYRYSCVYLLSSEHEGEFEDETTYFEYLHAIDTMQVAD